VLLATMIASLLAPAVVHAGEITVTRLGTGCPPPVMHRFDPSILVEAGGHSAAVRRRPRRLAATPPDQGAVARREGVFLTHLHSDHVVGFPDLWLTGWLTAPGRSTPVPLWDHAARRR
jgi:ribonuclease Z